MSPCALSLSLPQCVGVPLRLCDAEKECDACVPLSTVFFCGAKHACVPGRRTYQDALCYLYGDMTFGEAIWTMTVPPLMTLILFCIPGLNFFTIPLVQTLEACCRPTAVHPSDEDPESRPRKR